MQRLYFTYILASKYNGTLYIGVTNNLRRRLEDHRTGRVRWADPSKRTSPVSHPRSRSFAFKHECYRLVYYETYPYVTDAIKREKQLKEWNRSWKIRLIETDNPDWLDRSSELG